MRTRPMRAQFVLPTLPRNPLLRALVLFGGLALVAALLAVGFIVGVAALAVAAVVLGIRRWRHRRVDRAAGPSIIEGQFTVVPARTPAELPRPD